MQVTSQGVYTKYPTAVTTPALGHDACFSQGMKTDIPPLLPPSHSIKQNQEMLPEIFAKGVIYIFIFFSSYKNKIPQNFLQTSTEIQPQLQKLPWHLKRWTGALLRCISKQLLTSFKQSQYFPIYRCIKFINRVVLQSHLYFRTVFPILLIFSRADQEFVSVFSRFKHFPDQRA